MSTAEGRDLTVPEDAAELVAELRRHGVRTGQRLRIVPAAEQPAEGSSRQRTLGFVGSVAGGPADVSQRIDDYLRGFGQ